MIVQCPSCQAKFKLADEKVTAKGVKIRCSKCAHVFTVKQGDDAGAAAPAPKAAAAPGGQGGQGAQAGQAGKTGFKDFNFDDFADISTKSQAAKQPAAAPAPKPATPPAPKPPAPKPAAKPAANDDDLSDFFSAGTDAPLPPPKPKPAAPKPAAPKAPPPSNDPFGDLNTPAPAKAKSVVKKPAAAPEGGDGLDDLFASQPPPPAPAAKPKPPVPKPPSPKAAPPPPPPAKSRAPAPKPPPPPQEEQEPDFSGNIELDTKREGFGNVFADAPPPPASGGGGRGSEDSFDSLISSSAAGFGDAPPPPPGGGGGTIDLDSKGAKTLEFLSRAGDGSRRKVVQSGGPPPGIIAAITVGIAIVLVIGFRAAVEFAPESLPGISLENARSIRDVVPFPVTNPHFPEAPPKIEAHVDQGYTVKNLAGEVIYVAPGKLVNRSGVPMNFLRVRLKLVDKMGATLQEKTVYAGNVISVDRLQKTDPKDLDSELQRKLGSNNNNMNVGNNTTINFMAIFYQYGGEPSAVQIVEATAGS